MHSTRSAGFSMVELVITIAILAILLALAFPSFEGSMRNNRLATATNELIAAMSLARSEALRSTHGGGICASADGLACGDDWNAGWLVWTEGESSTPGVFNASEDTVVRVIEGRPRLVIGAANSSSVAIDAIGFDHRGRPLHAAGGEITFDVRPETCPSGQELVRELKMNLSGQVVNHKEACP